MIRKIVIVATLCVFVAESSTQIFHRSRRSVDTCGVAKILQPYIIQGKSFTRGTFPWVVALTHLDFLPPLFFCAGTLISKTFVISAAHCIHPKQETEKLLPADILAFFGAHKLNNSQEAERFELSPKEIFLHPEWNASALNYDGDLSLLEFEAGKISFNNFVQPICLWKSENELNSTHGIVTGWGWSGNPERNYENIPKMINASIHANEDCWLEEHRLLKLSSKRTFCASPGDGSGVCAGDSGGGFFIKIGGVYHLKGVVSTSLTGEIGCDVSVKAVYSNVPKYKDWIESTVYPAAVLCSFQRRKSFLLEKTVNHCDIKDKIENENYVLGSPIDTTCQTFYIRDNKNVKYLPRQITEILPSLEEMNVISCGLTIVRDFYFKNMRNLRFLLLNDNEIVTIETNAFKNLVSVENLWLSNNLIQTLDEKLFASMTSLEQIYLTSNKIKFLSPATFKIPGGKLGIVNLVDNICIHQVYNRPKQRNRIESDLRSQCSSNSKALTPQVLKNVVCTFDQDDSIYLNRKARRCSADQKIESEDYFVLKEPIRDDIEIFVIFVNKYVKFLPKNVGEKFPNLKEFDVRNCGLTIVRDFYFKNMRNLKFLLLIDNKIARIEPEAFKGLVSVEKLWLHDNLIETLDENLFASMLSVKEIYLVRNKIKFLSSATFKISDGSLDRVDLRGNVCIDQNYLSDHNLDNLNKLESDLRAACSRRFF